MGYATTIRGELAISPPIPWGRIRTSCFLPDVARMHQKDVMFLIHEKDRETDEGTVIARSAVALVPSWEEDARARNLVEHVQDVIDAYPEHAVTGRLNCFGEEPGDLWRVEIQDGRAVRVAARVVWPDGSEGVTN